MDIQRIMENIQRRNLSPFLEKIYRPLFQMLPTSGIKIVEEDWDHLIILDACRYDTFEELNWIDGTLEKRRSLGSKTMEWAEKNFQDYCSDTVYISSNPNISKSEQATIYTENHFYDSIDVFLENDRDCDGGTRPEIVTKRAIEASERWPNKRLIVHYVQPHLPYIGNPSITWTDDEIERRHDFFIHPDTKEAYRGNLKLVLEEVENLLNHIKGRIVITSDHGEAFGEKGIYGHPYGVHIKELVEVPWLVIEQGERPNIRSEEITGIDI